MTPSASRSRLLARLLTVSAIAATACQDDSETSSTGVVQNGAAGSTSTGGSGQGGSGVSGSPGQGGSGVSGTSGHAGAPTAGAAGTSVTAGAGGSEPLPACKFSPCVNFEGLCYERGDEEACAPADSPAAWSQIGCEVKVSEGAYLTENGAKCCYNSFCGEGRPLLISGALTHAATSLRGDWG